MIGTKLAQYEIIEELGQGGMATVYRAYQPHMDRYVAVKVIRQSIVEEANARERFQREARIIARLEHPHLLPVHDFDGAHKPPYIVMRYLEGGTLKEALSNRRLPFDEITYLLRQVGSALDYAHRQGVVHRDIKPSNIMIDREGNAFVMDFGIARITDHQGGGDLTGTGTIIGTPDYMAPEQGYATSEIGLQADIYSLGVMLFEMVTGQLPFKGASPMETMLFHLSKEVPSAAELNPELPPEVDRLFQKAMAKEPGDRHQSVVEFTAEAVHILGDNIATTPETLQEAAQDSLAMVAERRAGLQDQIQATMAEFASDRKAKQTGTDSQATPSQQHRTVTALYADVAEYNEIVELEEGPEAARRAVQDLWAQAGRIVDKNGGIVFSQSDRDLLAVWGAVSAREDDPEQAITTSLAVQDTLRAQAGDLLAEDEPIPIGIGVNTGPALIAVEDDTGSFTASGATVNLASKVAGNADGLVLITQDTYRHVQGVFDIEKERPLRVRRSGGWAQTDTYRVNEAKPRAFRLQPRGVEGIDTHMIGRRAELEEIQKAYYTAIEDSETQVVTVVGPPGMGKSRLLYEFAAWAELRPEKFYIFRGRATPSMTSRPYGLWRDILSFRFEILDSDSPEIVGQKLTAGVADLAGGDDKLAHLIGHLAGFDIPDSPHLAGEPEGIAQQSREAVIQFFQLLVQRDPVVIQLEDLHHADDSSLDLLVEITSADEELPLLLLAMARPALYTRRPTWGSGQEFHTRVDLRPLSKRDSRELASEILQKVDSVPRELRDLLVDRAEGNPHYMEELVKMMVEDRVIQKVDQDLWTVESSRLKSLRVPPTLVGLLQARFDSLLYPEKLTLQRSAVVGRVFYHSAVMALDAADHTHIDDLNGIFQVLTEREFVFPRETSAFEGTTEYIFGQAMMRDLILETLLENQRTTYNKAMAQWLSVQGGQRAGEYDGLIADHYEQAGEYFLAADYLSRASKAAFKLSAYPQGLDAGMKTLELLDQCDPSAEVIELQLDTQILLADALGLLGRYNQAEKLLKSALTSARATGDRKAEADALAHIGRIKGTFLDDYDSASQYMQQALEINKELDDKPGLVFILRQLGNLTFGSGDLEKGAEYLNQSLELAEEIGDLESMGHALNSLGVNAWSSGEIERSLSYYDRGLEIQRQLDDRLSMAMLLSNISWDNTELGSFDEAARSSEEAMKLAVEVDSRSLIASSYSVQGWIALANGQYEVARERLLKAMEFRDLGEEWGLLTNVNSFAWLEGKTGDVNRALEWLGMAKSHLYYEKTGMRRFIDKALAEISAGQQEAEGEAALARGSHRTLNDVVDEILSIYQQ